MSLVSLIFGMLVGISLGLTGGGGAIFAVPLLVYGLAVDPREAVGTSLVAVSGTALVGFLQRARNGTVEFTTGLLFAVAAMLTAPVGVWLSAQISESVLLVLFGLLMLAIAARMWRNTTYRQSPTAGEAASTISGQTCHRGPEGELTMTSRCAMLLATVGLGTGILTGLFGIGGGFLIVPALVTFSRMEMRRAIGTSLLVITLVSLSGIASYVINGGRIPLQITIMFLVGGLLGMWVGTGVAKRLAGRRLQQVFAAAIVAVGLFVIIRNVWA